MSNFFTGLLSKTADDITPPPLLPMGTYLAAIKDHPKMSEFKGNAQNTAGWDVLEFTLEIISADNVDAVDLEEYEAKATVAGTTLRQPFMFTKEEGAEASRMSTEDRLKTFLKKGGVDFEGSMTLREALGQSVKAQYLVEVTHQPDKNDAEKMFAQIKNIHQV